LYLNRGKVLIQTKVKESTNIIT